MSWGDIFAGLAGGARSYAQDRARLDERRVDLEQAAADRALRERRMTLDEQSAQRDQAAQLLDRSLKLLGSADEGTEISQSLYDSLDPQARELFTRHQDVPPSVTGRSLSGFAGLPGAEDAGEGELLAAPMIAEFTRPGPRHTVNPPIEQKIRLAQVREQRQASNDANRHTEAMARLQNTAAYQEALVTIASERNTLRRQQMQQALGLAMSRIGLQAAHLDQRRLDYNLALAWKQALAEDSGYTFAAPPPAQRVKPATPTSSAPPAAPAAQPNDNDALLDRLFGPAK